MTATEEEHHLDQQTSAPAPDPSLPDYLVSPNAVLGDHDAEWRYGKAPDYSNTRKVWEQTKKSNHAAGSLPQLVENLVKNWEVEASFKSRLSDWRTVDPVNYSFAINGGTPQSAEHMLKVGTYNAIIVPNEYYSPANSDFASSHKTFKRMMPTFAWEVLEVYSGPPKVVFRWRHWGEMKNDYVAFNDKGEKVTAKAHGGPIDITGVTIATVDDKVRLQTVDTYYDPMQMFRQIAPGGIVNKEIMNHKVDKSAALDWIADFANGVAIAESHNAHAGEHSDEPAPQDIIPPQISTTTGKPADAFIPFQGAETSAPKTPPEFAQADHLEVVTQQPESNGGFQDSTVASTPIASSEEGDKTWEKIDHPEQTLSLEQPAGANNDAMDFLEKHLSQPASTVHPHPHDAEQAVQPEAGEAVAAAPSTEETRMTHEEMGRLAGGECPFLMNRE